MIIFEFDLDSGQNRDIYWIGVTEVTKEDQNHIDEIYEQLDAELAYNI